MSPVSAGPGADAAFPAAEDIPGEATTGAADPAARGTNQAGMRDHNERLVLSLVRASGALAKSDIARLTGLSAQTVSVIMRALEQDGLLQRGEPVRGKVGQPSVPLRLAPEGAAFAGLKIGRRSGDLALIDFAGGLRGSRRRLWRYPSPDAVLDFVAEALPALRATLPPPMRGRLAALGVAMPFQLWEWSGEVAAPPAELDAWRNRDIAAELSALTGLSVTLRNDATAACGAELVFGTGERLRDALYIFVGFFVGGGLVLGGRLFVGRTGNAAGLGTIPVPAPGGRMRPLLEVASLAPLGRAFAAAGGDEDMLWRAPEGWDMPAALLDDWIGAAAAGLAAAAYAAAGLIEIESVVIDGWLPAALRARLVAATSEAWAGLDLAGITPLTIREGSIGPQARALGAAAIPLAQRYLLDAALA